MKKTLIFLFTLFLIGCKCTIAQIPPIPAYVDEACNAKMPDVLSQIIVADNCELSSVAQIPLAGTDITPPITGQVIATDVSGNITTASFQVYALDTISPSITWQGPSVASLHEGFDEAERNYSRFISWVKKDTMFYIKEFKPDRDDEGNITWYREIEIPLFDGDTLAWYNTVAVR